MKSESEWGLGEPMVVLAQLTGGTLVLASFFLVPAFYVDSGHNVSMLAYLGFVDDLQEGTDNPLWLTLYAWWLLPVGGAVAVMHAVLLSAGTVSRRSAGRVGVLTGGVVVGGLLIGCIGEALSNWIEFDAELDVVLRAVVRPVIGLWDGAPTFSLSALGGSTMLLGGLAAARMASAEEYAQVAR